jgi:protein-tyrosine phosphatase
MVKSSDNIVSPRVVCDGQGTCRIDWEGEGSGQVSVYVDTSPSVSHTSQRVDAAAGQHRVDVHGLDPGVRHYFLVQPRNARGLTTAERRVPFDGPVNFRDMGGYETADNRRVKWGVVYRADSLSTLSDKDLDLFVRLGIRGVYDFRAPAEVAKSPDRLPVGNTVAYHHLPVVSSDFDTVAAVERLKKKDTSWLTETFMVDGYRRNIDRYARTWGAVIDDLAHADRRPLVFHCTAGKDRTGICAALILLVLGVSEEVVAFDHALSNQYFASTVERINGYIRSLGVDPGKIAPYLTAPRDAIEFVFGYIRERWGTAANYLKTEAGVSQATLDALGRDLLE